eukprot:scaffold71479_cov48-Phaeocystis_antarctica.AAC.1
MRLEIERDCNLIELGHLARRRRRRGERRGVERLVHHAARECLAVESKVSNQVERYHALLRQARCTAPQTYYWYLRTYLLAYSLTCFTCLRTHLAVGHAHLTSAHLEPPLRPQPLDHHLHETHVT